ncbi:polysaccharide biosynthesis/export family protein [Sphingomonas jaspsi]|uniref:polysaccharide biosynthesis/export family protein n=1 Tax=Sphingomonas jaspsi TaxID=392409 RepID=UPI0004B6E862|nr:polysaccharide biosynthesis/export family protein [Sphingomonas jaspsi]
MLSLAIGASLLSSCADHRGGPIPYDVQNFGVPDAPSATALGAGYRIAPMDTVSVKVFKMPDLSGDYEVDLTGQLSMPLIGNVDASNLTMAELDQRLTQRLGEKYLENPDVTVSLKSSTLRSVTIDGAVNKSGSFPVMGPTSLMQAVALAGGTTQDANNRRVAIFRTISGKRQAAAFDLTSIRRGETPDPQVYPGDIVIVDGSSIKSIQKQILNSLPVISIFKPF